MGVLTQTSGVPMAAGDIDLNRDTLANVQKMLLEERDLILGSKFAEPVSGMLGTGSDRAQTLAQAVHQGHENIKKTFASTADGLKSTCDHIGEAIKQIDTADLDIAAAAACLSAATSLLCTPYIPLTAAAQRFLADGPTAV